MIKIANAAHEQQPFTQHKSESESCEHTFSDYVIIADDDEGSEVHERMHVEPTKYSVKCLRKLSRRENNSGRSSRHTNNCESRQLQPLWVGTGTVHL